MRWSRLSRSSRLVCDQVANARAAASARAYWREELANFSSVTPVPLARKSTLRSISDVADVFERLSADETQAFNQFVQEHRLTQNTLFDGFSQEWFVPPASGATAKAAVRARRGHKLTGQSGARLLRGFKW